MSLKKKKKTEVMQPVRGRHPRGKRKKNHLIIMDLLVRLALTLYLVLTHSNTHTQKTYTVLHIPSIGKYIICHPTCMQRHPLAHRRRYKSRDTSPTAANNSNILMYICTSDICSTLGISHVTYCISIQHQTCSRHRV